MRDVSQRVAAGFIVFVVFVIAGAFLAQVSSCLGSTQDDAFISYRYARNFATGQGLVYNPGERVEGYTNFLWTVLLALVVASGGDPVRVAPLIGVAAAAAIVLLLVVAGRREAASEMASEPSARASEGFPLPTIGAGLTAAAFLVAGSAFSAEAVQGLETPLFALLITAAILLDAREREGGRASRGGRSGWIYGLASLTRPEGVGAFGLAAVLRLAGLFRGGAPGSRGATLRAEGSWAARALVPVAVHMTFRWIYYRDLVPNTFHTKVGFSAAALARGGGYVGSFTMAYLPVLLLAAVGVFSERGRERGRLVGAWIMVHVVYVACVGGDYKPTFRFFAPVIPLLCLMAGIGLATLLRSLAGSVRARAALAQTAAASVACGFLWFASADARAFTEWRRSVLPTHTAAGRWLAARFPPTTLLATSNAGVLPYYSGLPTIDMLGLCDPVIARRSMPPGGLAMAGHEKGDGAYVLSREPDLILFMQARFASDPIPEPLVGRLAFGVSEVEMWNDEALHRLYRWTSASLPGFTFNYYERATRGPGSSRTGQAP